MRSRRLGGEVQAVERAITCATVRSGLRNGTAVPFLTIDPSRINPDGTQTERGRSVVNPDEDATQYGPGLFTDGCEGAPRSVCVCGKEQTA